MPRKQRSWSVPFAGTVCWMIALCSAMPAFAVQTDPNSPDRLTAEQVADGVRQARTLLLQHEAGWDIRYTLNVDQHPEKGDYAFQGVEGSVRLDWPKLFCRSKGTLQQSGAVLERTATYDFSTGVSVARENENIYQICPFRHVWCSKTIYPFAFQYYEEFSQYYHPGQDVQDFKGSGQSPCLWLPTAFAACAYKVEGIETVDGIPCHVLHGEHDSLWIATEHSFVLCKRELHFEETQRIRERLVSRDLREIAPDLWFPFQQIRTQFEAPVDAGDEDEPLEIERLELSVTSFTPGPLPDDAFSIDMPEGIMVEDLVRGISYTNHGEGGDPMDGAVERANAAESDVERNNLVELALWGNLAVILACVIFWYARRSRG